jgi:hypothetical protein
MIKLTANQADAMLSLGNYVGETIEVLTSEYDANVDRDFVRRSKGRFNSSTLRGLEAKGFIKIELAFWKGARLTVLKAA